ncbi:MAG: DUF3106 domain-containing protein [Planctomycetota bacterium]
MSGAAAVLALFAVSAGAAQESASVDQRRLQAFRKLPPEEQARLLGRLEELKRLPPEERQRLRENLKKIKSMSPEEIRRVREKVQRLTPEEQKAYAELALGFFRWAHRQGYVAGFPRGLFFTWLKNERPEKIEEIRALRPEIEGVDPRVDAFVKLSYEFRDVMRTRTEEHLRRHRCSDPEDAAALREASPREFWPRWQEIMRRCQARRAAPGPVRPRPEESPK